MSKKIMIDDILELLEKLMEHVGHSSSCEYIMFNYPCDCSYTEFMKKIEGIKTRV